MGNLLLDRQHQWVELLGRPVQLELGCLDRHHQLELVQEPWQQVPGQLELVQRILVEPAGLQRIPVVVVVGELDNLLVDILPVAGILAGSLPGILVELRRILGQCFLQNMELEVGGERRQELVGSHIHHHHRRRRRQWWSGQGEGQIQVGSFWNSLGIQKSEAKE